MSRKTDRAKHGPGWIEVIFGALLSLVLGVLVGALLLAFRPVVVVKEMPKEEARKNMQLFADKVLPELKSWEAETSIDERFLDAAE